MDIEARPKTAFSIGTGLWQFKTMPFGLCNAPQTFERLMELVLAGLPWSTCMVYLDDIVVHGTSFKQTLERLDLVFDRLQAAGLKLNPKKCELFRNEVSYLGHIISGEGVKTDPVKTQTVQDWPTPQNVQEVRSFLGLCTYYRRFVKDFATVAKPLHELTQKNRRFCWNERCDEAFLTLKKALTTAPILQFPTCRDQFVVDTDASQDGIGGVLSQLVDGKEHVIAYYSRTLRGPERNYCVTRKELLAVVATVKHFHHYLYGRHFVIRSDHASLRWLMNFRQPEGQLARWMQVLGGYDFVIEHRAGRQHSNADAMSRRPCSEDDCHYCARAETKSTDGNSTQSRAAKMTSAERGNEKFRDEQLKDDIIGKVLQLKESYGDKPEWADISHHGLQVKAYWAQWESLQVISGVLCRKWESPRGDSFKLQRVLPASLRSEVMRELHDNVTAGHLGVNKTLERVRERYYWLHYREDVKMHCQSCDKCSSRKGPARKARSKLQKYQVGRPMERWAIDVMGPLPETDSGNKYVLVMMDYFTKWPEVHAIPNQEAVTVANVFVKEVVARFGVPFQLHSDQGRNFEAAVFQQMCTILGVNKTRTTPLHPASDGMVERYNRTLQNQLALYVNDHQTDWDDHLPLLSMAYRTAIHESTSYSPSRLLFGREIKVPLDLLHGQPPGDEEENEQKYTKYSEQLGEKLHSIHEHAREHLTISGENLKTRYDIRANTHAFKEGDQVWLHNPRRKKGVSPKLTSDWEGPYSVLKKINDVVYRIQLTRRSKPRVVHRDRLCKYKGQKEPWFHVSDDNCSFIAVATQTSTQEHPELSEKNQVCQPDDAPDEEPSRENSHEHQRRQRKSPNRYGWD